MLEIRRDICKDATYCADAKKFRYEIEMPKDVKVEDDDFECTNTLAKVKRYVSNHLEELVKELE